MYASIYIYRLPRAHLAAFLEVQQAAREIYCRYGAKDDETWAPTQLEAKYGCTAFPAVLETAQDEVVVISLSRFHDRAHHDAVMALVDADESMSALYQQVGRLMDIGQIVRGEFERCV